MQVLLLSAYDAVSHRLWREGMVAAFPEYTWHVHTLPARHFSWRIRGNPLDFAFSQAIDSKTYDLIIVTSMVDLAVLKGLCPNLSRVPSLVYFHENQFAYPISKLAKNSIEPSMVNLYSALAADRVCFNSEYNQNTFLEGLSALFRKLPDYAPLSVIEVLRNKSFVLPVPLLDDVFTSNSVNNRSRSLVWNHRWEYDKGPKRFLEVLKGLPELDNFTVHVVGQRFNRDPDCMSEIKNLLANRGWMGQWGPIENRSAYLDLLSRSKIVLSTALHDFQGVSVLEGMANSCYPIVPNRLAYPEFVPESYRYYAAKDDSEQELSKEAASAVNMIENVLKEGDSTFSNKALSWAKLKPAYEASIRDCLNLHR